MRARLLTASAATLLTVGGLGVAHGAGPMLVNGAGEPLVWAASPVPFNPDRGSLGGLSNFAAVTAVKDNFAVWSAVPTTSIRFAKGDPLPVDVTAANWWQYLGVCDGLNEIIFDTDGEIIDGIFGTGASNEILGFAGPACGTFVPPVITEGMAVLNGKWIDGVNSGTNREMPLADFNGVFIHEFGHYVNLDHSQINFVEAFDGDPDNNFAVATMFPYAVKGADAAVLHLDDTVSVSMLYPAPTFATDFGSFTGNVFRDGVTRFQGAYVIARKLDDPRMQAVGVASGARYFPTAAGGPAPTALRGLYEIPGLPPGDYTVEIEEVSQLFTGGSSVGPLDPPARLPGEPEFYNGPNEAGASPPDDPAESVPVTAAAGITQDELNFLINGFPPPSNDACTGADEVSTLPFTGIVDTLGATTDDTDPWQPCGYEGGSRNSASVWYLLTSAVDTYISIDTVGSSYDTILSAYTGACLALNQIACNDDWGSRLQSKITVRVTPSAPVLVEVTSFGATGGGTLVVNAGPPVGCGATPVPGCSGAERTDARLTDSTIAKKDQLLWKWMGTLPGWPYLFGDPTENTDYVLCVYDTVLGSPTLTMSALAPAASSTCSTGRCWDRKGLTNFAFRDADNNLDGLGKIALKSAITGKTRIKLKGNGLNLGMPGLPLKKQDGVIVQLLNSDGGCWGAEYGAASCSGSNPIRCTYTP